MEPIILPHFQNYCCSQLMNFEQYFDFYKDFSIFPDIINLSLLKLIFYSLAEIMHSESIKNKSKLIEIIF